MASGRISSGRSFRKACEFKRTLVKTVKTPSRVNRESIKGSQLRFAGRLYRIKPTALLQTAFSFLVYPTFLLRSCLINVKWPRFKKIN